MAILTTQLQTGSEFFQSNTDYVRGLVEDLTQQVQRIKSGSRESSHE